MITNNGRSEALCAEEREKRKTWWQWLQVGRIPSDTAEWVSGDQLNLLFPCGPLYGGKYEYCRIDHTSEAKDQEELDEAVEDYYRTGGRRFPSPSGKVVIEKKH